MNISSPRTKPEEKLQKEVCKYIQSYYPNVYFMSDPSGLRVTPGLRDLLMKTRSNHAQLDLLIMEPCREFKALIIELKSESPFKLNGELRTDKHLADQKLTMELLESKGYKCSWCWSLEQAKLILENYLGKPYVDDRPLF